MAGLEDTIDVHGRLFLNTGEPGIGKTRMAEQLASRARQRGARVLWGRCWEGGGAPAYWPWSQLLRPLLDDPPEDSRAAAGTDAGAAAGADGAALRRFSPELADTVGEGTSADPAAQSAAARFRLFAAVTSLLQRASAGQPLLLVLDDLHAADPASLMLLRFVARELRATRLLVVAAYRAVEARQRAEVAEVLGELIREGPSRQLRGFGRAEVRHFVASLTGLTVSEDALARIADATGGNPLFIRELVRLVGSEGAPDGRAHPALSAGVRAVIHQRLASLAAEATEVLAVAAVVGQEFEVPLVAQVAGRDLVDVVHSLAQAERRELLRRAPGSRTAFRFAHGLVREALCDDLPGALRRELHGRVARAIERLSGGDLTARLAELAYHAYHAAEGAGPAAAVQASEYARRAGDQALACCAYEEAALQYRRALEVLRLAGPEAARCGELLVRLGGAQARAGAYQAARGSFGRAAALARQLGAPELLARAPLGFGEPQVEGGRGKGRPAARGPAARSPRRTEPRRQRAARPGAGPLLARAHLRRRAAAAGDGPGVAQPGSPGDGPAAR